MYNESPDFRGVFYVFINVNRVGILMRTIHYITFSLMWLFLCPVCFGYFDGSGSVSDPYQISNHDDLLELANTPADYSKYFVLTADIDMQGLVFNTAIIAKDTNNITSGFQGTAFAGSLDGGGHKITNFVVDGGSNDFLGLFGQIESGAVKNLGLENCVITYTSDSDFIGGLAGYNSAASISNCYMTGDVNGDVNGDSKSFRIGGLIGLNLTGVIDRCYTTGNVEGMFNVQFIGGLVGSNVNATISYCYATGAVNGQQDVGGLCGSSNGILIHCYATGVVSGPSNTEYLGGLCGSNFGMIASCYASGAVNTGAGSMSIGGLCGGNSSVDAIINCYATGSVTGGDFSSTLGGLCGENSFGVIMNCYSTGAVVGGNSSNLLGGLCGYQIGDISEIANSFWDVETSHIPVGYNPDPDLPGTITNVYDKTTSQMWTRSTFTDYGWDFVGEAVNGTEDIWRMCEDGIDYPRLTWQSVAGDFGCPAGVGPEDLDVMIGCWLSVIRASADINDDNAVNLLDLSILARYWQVSDCGLCGGADVTGDGNVDNADLTVMIEKWLVRENAGCRMADLNADDEIDLEDLAIFSQHWLEGI
jgi:hypothetical protein